LSVFLGDAHIYANAVDMLQEQLKREPLPLPRLVISENIPEYAKTGKYEPEWIAKAQVGDFSLDGYQHHPKLTTDMAI
jgi:thymidylate synthase